MQEFSRVLNLYGTEVCLVSNEETLISNDEYFKGKGSRLHSLLSNFLRFDDAEYTGKHDYFLYLFHKKGAPFDVAIGEKSSYFSGDLLWNDSMQKDKRITIFGNMGIFSKIFVGLLERKGIFSFHSTSFYDPDKNRIYLVLGGSGSGKSTVLLAAIEQGYQVFGTELTHFTMLGEKIRFLKGSLYQNCRVGNLVEDFPGLIEKFSITGLPETNVWHQYLSVDFRDIAFQGDALDNPEVVVIFSKIEANRGEPEVFEKDPAGLSKPIFDSLSEKIAAPTWVYGKHIVPDIDTFEMVDRRKKGAEAFCRNANIIRAWRVLAAPENCLDEVMKS